MSPPRNTDSAKPDRTADRTADRIADRTADRTARGALLGRRDLVVVGGGPVGVAALWYAKRLGLEAVGIEAGPTPLTSVLRYPRGLVMVSGPREWEIEGLPVDCQDTQEVTREDLLSYYTRVLGLGRLSVACGQRLVDLEPTRGGVRVVVDVEEPRTRGGGTAPPRRGHWLAERVVLTPWFRPRRLAMEPRHLRIVEGLPEPATLAGEDIAILGAGLSGVEQADALIRAGLRVTLIARRGARLPPAQAALFAVSGSRVITDVDEVREGPRGQLDLLLVGGARERIPCTALVHCTGHEANLDLLSLLERRDLVDADEVRALTALRAPGTRQGFGARWPTEVATRLPRFASALFDGRRGVHFAGSVHHVGGISGAGILHSIETARWAVQRAAGLPASSSSPGVPVPTAADHVPSFLLEQLGPRYERRAALLAQRLADGLVPTALLAQLCPVPVTSFSRGTRIFIDEDAVGRLGAPPSRASRAHGVARQRVLTALRTSAEAGLSVAALAEELSVSQPTLLRALGVLWFGNGLSWVPPHTPLLEGPLIGDEAPATAGAAGV